MVTFASPKIVEEVRTAIEAKVAVPSLLQNPPSGLRMATSNQILTIWGYLQCRGDLESVISGIEEYRREDFPKFRDFATKWEWNRDYHTQSLSFFMALLREVPSFKGTYLNADSILRSSRTFRQMHSSPQPNGSAEEMRSDIIRILALCGITDLSVGGQIVDPGPEETLAIRKIAEERFGLDPKHRMPIMGTVCQILLRFGIRTSSSVHKTKKTRRRVHSLSPQDLAVLGVKPPSSELKPVPMGFSDEEKDFIYLLTLGGRTPSQVKQITGVINLQIYLPRLQRRLQLVESLPPIHEKNLRSYLETYKVIPYLISQVAVAVMENGGYDFDVPSKTRDLWINVKTYLPNGPEKDFIDRVVSRIGDFRLYHFRGQTTPFRVKMRDDTIVSPSVIAGLRVKDGHICHLRKWGAVHVAK